MEFEQFHLESLGHASYLVGSSDVRVGVPVVGRRVASGTQRPRQRRQPDGGMAAWKQAGLPLD